MQTVNRDMIEEALADAGANEDSLYESYSGRGMYGSRCFGIVVPGVKTAIRFFLAFPIGEAQLVDDLVDAMATDSMGLDTIYYFPGFQVEEEDEFEDDEDIEVDEA